MDEAIKSVLLQDIGFRENVQLILVDDGSTDKSATICDSYLQKYSDNIIVIHKENGGVASARNAGLPYAEGRYLNFMDSDDKLTSNVLSEVYKFFVNHEEETDIVTIPIYFFDEGQGEHYLNYKFQEGTRIIDLSVEYDAIVRATNATFFTHQCKEEIWFDDRLAIGEDTKVVLSLLYRKMKLGVVSSCKYMYRIRKNSGTSLMGQHHTKKRGYYFEYFTYLTDWIMGFYKEKVGFVPGFIQYANMLEFAWRIRSKYDISQVLTTEEIEIYKNKLFNSFRYIDDKYILAQKIISLEYKNFILSKKYGNNPEITFCNNDAWIHFGGSMICRISDCDTTLEFIEYKDNTLYLEGFTKVLPANDDENIQVYLLCNEDKIRCELTQRENINDSRFNEVICKGRGFKCKVYIATLPTHGEIKFGITFRGIDIIKKNFRFGKFFPIAENLKNSYYYENNFIITAKDGVLLWRKCTKQSAKKQEVLLVKELWNTKGKAAKKAAISRCFCHLLKPLLKKEIWLLSDRINKADDNGEALFKYINENNLPVNAYFILQRRSTDYPGVRKFGKVVGYMSWKHKFLYLLADKIISAAADEYVYNPFMRNKKYYKDILAKKKRIFLQHGIINNDLSSWLNKYSKNLTIFVTSAIPEYNSILSGNYFYDDKVIKLTGLARYDRLENRKQKIITIMPTWRLYLTSNDSYSTDGLKKYDENFKKSDYFNFYNSLINNEQLLNAAVKYNYKIKFMPHPNIIPYVDWFTKNDTVEFCSINTKYRDIFAESSFIVTDYSSVAFDFAYLRKPVIYCQFDKETLFSKHIAKKGYFDYERDGFGEVEYNLEGTVNRIIEYIENDCILKDMYKVRIDRFFAFNDKNNCQRICEAIQAIGNKN